MGVTIVVVAVPEGLPLAVTLSLAYSTQKMMQDNNLIRVLAACETMGNATTICSDKTGTLTQNRMTVVEGWLAGKYYEAVPSSKELPALLVKYISEDAALNSTANLMQNNAPGNNDGMPLVVGSKTEGALLVMVSEKLKLKLTTRSWSLVAMLPLIGRGFD
jgi:Ca2+-transporting ATPase